MKPPLAVPNSPTLTGGMRGTSIICFQMQNLHIQKDALVLWELTSAFRRRAIHVRLHPQTSGPASQIVPYFTSRV